MVTTWAYCINIGWAFLAMWLNPWLHHHLSLLLSLIPFFFPCDQFQLCSILNYEKYHPLPAIPPLFTSSLLLLFGWLSCFARPWPLSDDSSSVRGGVRVVLSYPYHMKNGNWLAHGSNVTMKAKLMMKTKPPSHFALCPHLLFDTPALRALVLLFPSPCVIAGWWPGTFGSGTEPDGHEGWRLELQSQGCHWRELRWRRRKSLYIRFTFRWLSAIVWLPLYRKEFPSPEKQTESVT